jgi:hypothetical protein
LIFNNKHCIFKRFLALNDPFGGQNGQFNEMGAWRGDKRKRLKAIWTQMNTDEHGLKRKFVSPSALGEDKGKRLI